VRGDEFAEDFGPGIDYFCFVEALAKSQTVPIATTSLS
jgi:hypothetical protein